jgi:hypothetical protein
MVGVVVLPLLELVVERAGVVDNDSVQLAVELFGVGAVRSLTLPFRRGVAGRM